MIKDSSEIKDTKLVLLASAVNFKNPGKGEIDGIVHKPVKQLQLHDCITAVMEVTDPPGKIKPGVNKGVGNRALYLQNGRTQALGRIHEIHSGRAENHLREP